MDPGSLQALAEKVDDMAFVMGTMTSKLLRLEMKLDELQDELDVHVSDRILALERDAGRTFDQAARAVVKQRYGTSFSRPFLADGADGLVRLSTPKPLGVHDGDEARSQHALLKTLARKLADRLVPCDGTTVDVIRDVLAAWGHANTASALDDLRALAGLEPDAAATLLLPVLEAFNGVAIALCCWFAFGGARATFRRPGPDHFRQVDAPLPSLHTRLHLDCRGAVRVLGSCVEIHAASCTASAFPAYGVHDVATCLLIRAFVASLLHAHATTFVLRGTVFVQRLEVVDRAVDLAMLTEPLVQAARPSFPPGAVLSLYVDIVNL